jgi:hypothetical protein
MKNTNSNSIVHDIYNNIEDLIRGSKFSEIQKGFSQLTDLEESYLNTYHNKKKEGVFYTKDKISDFMVKQVLKIYLNENSKQIQKITICDPACGSGVFILSAAEELLSHFRFFYPNLTIGELKSKILRNLYGFDINHSAVKLSILKLLHWSTYESTKYLKENFRILQSNIENLDSLLELNDVKFDIIIGNPPYGNILDQKQKKILKEADIFYNDIYCAFLLKSIEWTNGIISFLVPKSFLLRQGYIKFREKLLSISNILNIYDIGPKLFKKVTNEVQILLFEKKTSKEKNLEIKLYPDNHIITYTNQIVDDLRTCFNTNCNYNSLSKKIYYYTFELKCPNCNSNTFPLNRIRIKTDKNTLKIIKKIEEIGDLNYLNIKEYPKLIRGEEDLGLRKIKPLIEQNPRNSCFFVNAREDFYYFYFKKKKSFNIEKINPELLKGQNYEYYFKPKLLIKHNSIFPQAIFTKEKVCFTSSIYSLLYDDIQVLKYLSALLNSSLMQYYCFYAINNQMNTTINLNQYMIRHLPFIEINNKTDVCKYVDKITLNLNQSGGIFNSNIYILFKELDKLVFALYSLDNREIHEIITQIVDRNPFNRKIYSDFI